MYMYLRCMMQNLNLLNVPFYEYIEHRVSCIRRAAKSDLNIKVRRYLILIPIFDNKSFAKCEWERAGFEHTDITND